MLISYVKRVQYLYLMCSGESKFFVTSSAAVNFGIQLLPDDAII